MNIRRLIKTSALLGGALLFGHLQNDTLTFSRHIVADPKIPPAFSGFQILQISDLHNKAFGPNQARLLGRIQREAPDLIVITGDLIDRRRTDVETAMQFIRGAVMVAPVAFVPGNHEIRSGIYAGLKKQLTAAGVEVLYDRALTIRRNGTVLRVIGMGDFSYNYSCFSQRPRKFPQKLTHLVGKAPQSFQILLSHRPELLPLYARCGVDLVLSGHAHGGQVRLPAVGALYAPNQGIFPEYTHGLNQLGNTRMIVSRGLGNSRFPLRIFNLPEIVSVLLQPC